MTISWEEFENNIKEEYDGTNFVIKQLDHEINVLLQRRQAIMAKDVNPLVVQMDEILNSLNPSEFGGEYLYKSEWYKNLDLESWGIYKYVDTGNKEGVTDDIILVDSLNNIEKGSELLIEIDTGEKVQRTVSKVEYSDYYEGYLIYLDEDDATWDRKYMPDALYPKCIDPIDERACVAYNPCSDDFYKLPEWDDDLPEYVESDTIPLEVKYGVAPYTWTLIEGELDGWSLENESTNDNYNTLYSNNTCDLPAIVQVTDYCGNKTEEYVVINTSSQEISLSAPSVIYQGDDYIISVIGGTAPFEWEIKEQASISSCTDNKCVTLQNTTTSGSNNLIITDNSVCGSIIIRVKDKCGLISQCETEVYNTFEYKTIYNAGISYYGGTICTHCFYNEEAGKNFPYLIPIRCIFSNNFSLKWLKQPKLSEISNKLYETYYDSYKKDVSNKWLAFPECGSLENEQTEQFLDEDIVINKEFMEESYKKVGLKEDYKVIYSSSTTDMYKWVNNSNYRIIQLQDEPGGVSSYGKIPTDGSPCAWHEYIYIWEIPYYCYKYFCEDSTYGYYSNLDVPQSTTTFRREAASALSWVYLRSWADHEMVISVGYYPLYAYCGRQIFNTAWVEWANGNRKYPYAQTTVSIIDFDKVTIDKKMCKTSNYIWEVEEFGEEPTLEYIQTF
jgi:hypothetical protein